MSAIVTKILSSTVGLLLNKVRDSTAAKLKNGDVTNANIAGILMTDMKDVKTKLDDISRNYLNSSYAVLEVGINLLKVSLNELKLEQKAVTDPTQEDGDETSRMSSDAEFGILNEALELSSATGRMKTVSEFERAKRKFEEVGRTATYAFTNDALSIEERIMAAKLRIVATILECLDSPEVATEECLTILKQLYDLQEIVALFSVYLNQGFFPIFNKAERVDNVKSVMLMNYVVFQFVSKFSKKGYSYLGWPAIKLSDRCFQPILHWPEVSTTMSIGEELTQHPNIVIIHIGNQ